MVLRDLAVKTSVIGKAFKRAKGVQLTRKTALVALIMLLNVFHLAVAAAPSETPAPTAEDLIQLSSIDAPARLDFPVSYKTMIVVLTAYSATPDQTDDTPCITASGFDICENADAAVVAVNFLPFGTKIRIPDVFGNQIFTVKDRMHERFPDRVDILMPDRESAKNFGLKTALIQIL